MSQHSGCHFPGSHKNNNNENTNSETANRSEQTNKHARQPTAYCNIPGDTNSTGMSKNKSHCTSCRGECHNNVTGHHGCHTINVTGHRECHKLMSCDIMNDTKLMSQMSLNVNSTGMSKTKVIAHRVVMNVTTMSLDIVNVTN